MRGYDIRFLSKTVFTVIVNNRASSSLDIDEVNTGIAEVTVVQVGIFEFINFEVAASFLADSRFFDERECVFDLLSQLYFSSSSFKSLRVFPLSHPSWASKAGTCRTELFGRKIRHLHSLPFEGL